MNDNNNSIDEKFLDRNDVFALEFNRGFVFLQVTGWEQLQYKPYTGVSSINPQSSSGFSRLEDSNDNDILYVNEGDEKVIHAGIGHMPASVRRYTNYPESENRLRTIPNLSAPRPSNGDDYGYVDGDDSPYNNPTDVEELVIPPGVNLDFNFYNPDQNESKQPILNIRMREYNVEILDPREDSNTVKRVLNPGSPMPTYPVGSIDNQKSIGKLRNQWDVSPKSRDEIMGGR